MKEDRDLLKDLLETKFKDDVIESSGDGFVHVFDALQEKSGGRGSFFWYTIGGVLLMILVTLFMLFYVLEDKTSNSSSESKSEEKRAIEVPITNTTVDHVTSTSDQETKLILQDKNETRADMLQGNNSVTLVTEATTPNFSEEEEGSTKGLITVTYKASEKYATTDHTKYNRLPDSSMIVLRKNSRVNFTTSSQGNRKAAVIGTVFFNIREDESKPFIVFGKHCTIQVSGNSFAIHSDTKADRILLISGTAKVTHNTTKEVRKLIPGQSLRISTDGISVMQTSPNQFAWKTGRLHYENASIQDVVQSLRENYDAKIRILNTEILNCTFSGAFENASPIQVLKEIASTLTVQLSEQEDVFILKGKGCSL